MNNKGLQKPLIYIKKIDRSDGRVEYFHFEALDSNPASSKLKLYLKTYNKHTSGKIDFHNIVGISQ